MTELKYNERLKGRLISTKISQVDLGKTVKMSPSIISHILHGRWILKDSEKAKIAAALNCQVSDIF